MQREIYLDNSATTRPFDEVTEYMTRVYSEAYGNPSSLHTKGIEAERLIKKSRTALAESMGVDSREIYFTSGGTESNNLAIRGYLEANPRKGKHIITTPIEHPSVLEVVKYLSEKGYSVDYLKVDSSGLIDLESLKEMINSQTALVSIIYVNNETGVVQPLDAILKIIRASESQPAVHIDAVQAYGKLPVHPKKLGVDMVTVSSHKIHGPKGVGCLYVKRETKIKPILFGGGQESLVRSGTENVPGICGFGLASEIVHKALNENYKRVSELKKLFIEQLDMHLDQFKIVSPEDSIPYILNVSFKNIKAEVLLHHLEAGQIYVSTGSACSSRKNVHSHVLQAIQLERCYIEGAIRFSFSALNTEEDIMETVEALKEIVPRIRIRKK